MYCELYNKNGNCFKLMKDLKTIKGYCNRIAKAPILHKETIKIIIYYCDDSIGYYNDKTKIVIINF
jgi:hypothetical protein